MSNYLERLSVKLLSGGARLSAARRQRHADYLRAAQQADGGFAGREGASDLYYTSFALRGLSLLGELPGAPAERAAGYLQDKLRSQVPLVDFLSLVYGAALLQAAGHDVFAGAAAGWQAAVAQMLESFRRPDGGYAQTPEGQSSSTYHTFLVVLCQQTLGLPIVERQRLIDFVGTRQRADGGFVEIGPMQRSGANPTAAAIGLLQALGALDDAARRGAIEFLVAMRGDDGGLRANGRIPWSDTLSTFTGFWTLLDAGAADRLDIPSVARYVLAHERAGGGFVAGAWDDAVDVEYTFYGLASLALAADAGCDVDAPLQSTELN